MWETYRKNFVGMQVVIFLITAAMFLLGGHQWLTAARFFVVMQVAALIGATWGYRLKKRSTRMLGERS